MNKVSTSPSLLKTVLSWFDSTAVNAPTSSGTRRIDWLRTIPFIALHIACIAVLWVGWSPIAVAVAILLYALRMFAITAFYHRYFSHRAFKTSRVLQFIFAALGASAVQRGPLWWASHHRHHHIHSDDQADEHSPGIYGFLWSHTGWFLSRENFPARDHLIRDYKKYPELQFLDRFDILIPVILGITLFLLGELLATLAPSLNTNGWQMLVWGFIISTVVLYHATFTINSLAHRIGKRRFKTKDNSRNHFLLALITFGEGWHNNHHFYPGSARQGFKWWEIDITFYVLKIMSWFGMIWELRPVPAHVKTSISNSSSEHPVGVNS